MTNEERAWNNFKIENAANIEVRRNGFEHVTWKPHAGRRVAFFAGIAEGKKIADQKQTEINELMEMIARIHTQKKELEEENKRLRDELNNYA